MTSDDFDVLSHLGALRRYARTLSRDAVAAEDLVQDALLRALTHRASYDPARPLKVWLFAVLRNTFLNGIERRRAERTKTAAFADVTETEATAGQEHAVRLAQVRARFERLPVEQREVIQLVGLEGLSYREAADALEIPIGTLMSRLGRARAALRAFETDPVEAPRPDLRIVGGRDT